ncbi:unnamed protein product, partial [Tetraodon nigroviridis]
GCEAAALWWDEAGGGFPVSGGGGSSSPRRSQRSGALPLSEGAQQEDGAAAGSVTCAPKAPSMNQSSQRPALLHPAWELLDPGCQPHVQALPRLPTFTAAAKARVFITFVLCGVSALCNLARAEARSRVHLLIVHLSVADLLVTFVVMPVDAAWNLTVQWLAGDLACRILMFLKLQAMYSCAFVTVVISLDRQWAVLHPLAVVTARRRNKALLVAAWTTSVLLSLPQV